tara:strand:- start:10378 stop:10614 length:237 start_codon:yes stop_codon:yes gene_type:complete
MSGQKKPKVFGGTSLSLESIFYEGYEIKSLKHGNTGLVLYKYPNKLYKWEGCWTSCIESAKTGVEKFLQQTKNKKTFK